jgi:hypothetical protein
MKRQAARISEKISEDKIREEKKIKDQRGDEKEVKTRQKNGREKKVKRIGKANRSCSLLAT